MSLLTLLPLLGCAGEPAPTPVVVVPVVPVAPPAPPPPEASPPAAFDLVISGKGAVFARWATVSEGSGLPEGHLVGLDPHGGTTLQQEIVVRAAPERAADGLPGVLADVTQQAQAALDAAKVSFAKPTAVAACTTTRDGTRCGDHAVSIGLLMGQDADCPGGMRATEFEPNVDGAPARAVTPVPRCGTRPLGVALATRGDVAALLVSWLTPGHEGARQAWSVVAVELTPPEGGDVPR